MNALTVIPFCILWLVACAFYIAYRGGRYPLWSTMIMLLGCAVPFACSSMKDSEVAKLVLILHGSATGGVVAFVFQRRLIRTWTIAGALATGLAFGLAGSLATLFLPPKPGYAKKWGDGVDAATAVFVLGAAFYGLYGGVCSVLTATIFHFGFQRNKLKSDTGDRE